MRGMNKISRGPKPMRIMWMLFVSIMSLVLLVASGLLVRDFMLYDVNIITENQLNSNTAFPSITVCHHHPFSADALPIWQSGRIMSPTNFNRRMRNITHQLLLQNRVNEAEQIINYEGVSIYYQNLDYQEATQVGHQKDVFLSCNQLSIYNHISFEDDCFKLEHYKVKRFSHHEHFNCYIFEAQSSEISTLGIIVSMGPEPDYKNSEQAFIVDTFNQAKGLKVIVHEPGTIPDIDNTGLHVEPGKMNDISYRPIEWRLSNSPNKPCYSDHKPGIYRDLEIQYNYTQDLCYKTEMQRQIMRKCQCMFIYHPRPEIPSEEMPYCGRFLEHFDIDRLNNQLKCIQKIFQEFSEDLTQVMQRLKCHQRCDFMKYETAISITRWRATEWHLHWIRLQVLTFRQFLEFQKNNTDRNSGYNITKSPPFSNWLQYWSSTNLTDLNHQHSSSDENFLAGENYAYIVLRRESKHSVRKYERLVISAYVLVSRIGGLCSLTVGITTSFFVELIEFTYLYYKSSKKQQQQQQERSPDSKEDSHDGNNNSDGSGGKLRQATKNAMINTVNSTAVIEDDEEKINKITSRTERKITIDLSNNSCMENTDIAI